MNERSKRDLEAADLEARAKALRRAEKTFWDEVNNRRDEIKKRFMMSDRFDEICLTYGAYTEADRESLYKHFMDEPQVMYYKRRVHKSEPYSED